MKTPKLQKDTASAFGLARKTTDVVAIEAAISEARTMIAEGEREEAAAEARYRDALLADDGDPAAALAEAQAAKIKRDRGEAQVAELTSRLAGIRADQERADRKAIHDDAVAKCEAIRVRLPDEYRHHALAIRGLLRDLAEAEVARQRAASLQEEFGPIPDPEYRLRGLGQVPEEIIERTEVSLWVINGRTEPVSAERQVQVRADAYGGDQGTLPHPGGAGFRCTRQRFTRVRYREAINPPHDAGSLYALVNLPAFHAYGDDFVTAERRRGADTALDHLSRDLRDRPETDRPVVERLDLVREPWPKSGEPALKVIPLGTAA